LHRQQQAERVHFRNLIGQLRVVTFRGKRESRKKAREKERFFGTRERMVRLLLWFSRIPNVHKMWQVMTMTMIGFLFVTRGKNHKSAEKQTFRGKWSREKKRTKKSKEKNSR
jgi:hypothetical protein